MLDTVQTWYLLIAGTITWWFTVGNICQTISKRQTPPQPPQTTVDTLFRGING